MKLFSSWEGVTALIALALAVLVWFGLPLIVPDISLAVLALIVALVVLGWLALFLVRRRNARHASDAIAGELAGAGAEEDASPSGCATP